jgi:hypothetical protein
VHHEYMARANSPPKAIKIDAAPISPQGIPGPFRQAPKALFGGHVRRAFLIYGDVAHFRFDHLSKSPSFGTVCGPKLAAEARAADAH